MANPFPTGRTRTLTAFGTFSIDSYGVSAAPSFNGLTGEGSFQFNFAGLQLNVSVTSAPGTPTGPTGATATVGASVPGVAPTGASGTLYAFLGFGTGGGVEPGTFSFSLDVQEMAGFYTPSSSSAVNGTNFPDYGGAAEGDGVPATGEQFYLQPLVGGNVTISISCASVSTTINTTITSGIAGIIGPISDYQLYILNDVRYNQFNGGATNIQTHAYDITWAANVMGVAWAVPGATWSSGGVSVDFASSMTASVPGSSAVPTKFAAGTAAFQPPTQFSLAARLRSWTSPFPGRETLTIQWKGTGSTVLNLAPSNNINWSQKKYQAGANLNGTIPPTIALDETSPVASWLTGISSSTGDDSRDWRMQFRGFAYDAMTIARSGNVVIDPCTATTRWTAGANTALSVPSGNLLAQASSGAGSITLAVPSTVRVWEAFRHLKISGSYSAQAYNGSTAYTVGQYVLQSGVIYVCSANTTGNAPPNVSFWAVYSGPLTLTVGLAGQTWPIMFTTTSADYDADLCCAGNETVTKDKYSSRFPIKPVGGGPINTDPTTQYELGWGVDWCDSVSITGILDGLNITLTDVELVLSTTDKQQRLTLVEPFLSFLNGWTDTGVSTTTVQQYALIETDYRVSDVGIALALVTPTGAGSPSYTFLTVAELVSYLQYLPGLTVTLLPDPPDTYHGSGGSALLVGSSGSTWSWTGSTWKDWIDLDISSGTITIPSQDLIDEVIVYPQAGNVWKELSSEPFGGATPLEITKFMRGQAWGLVFNTDQTPNPGQSVVAYLTANHAIGEGSATTGAMGEYLTGTPWGKGNLNITTECRAGTPVQTEAVVWNNRLRQRSSYRQNGPPPTTPMAAWGRPQQGWGYIASTDMMNVYINRYIVNPDTQFIAETFQADALAGTWVEGAINGQYLFYVQHGDTNVNYVISAGFEDQWGMPVTVAAGTDVKGYYAKELDMTMCAIFTGTIGGTGDWQAWTSIRGGTFVMQGTILSSVMNNGACLVYEEGPIKQWRFGYNNSSTITTLVSQNAGQVWM